MLLDLWLPGLHLMYMADIDRGKCLSRRLNALSGISWHLYTSFSYLWTSRLIWSPALVLWQEITLTCAVWKSHLRRPSNHHHMFSWSLLPVSGSSQGFGFHGRVATERMRMFSCSIFRMTILFLYLRTTCASFQADTSWKEPRLKPGF